MAGHIHIERKEMLKNCKVNINFQGGGSPAASFSIPFLREFNEKWRRKTSMKYKIFTVLAILGSTVAELFGGWDTALKTLLIFMVLDWLTGGIILPAVFRKSLKSPNGALESRAGWKGICRKGMTLLYVLIAARLDMVLGVEYIRNAVCIGFIANEVLSIVENAGLMGVPMPSMIKKAVDILKDTAESGAR